MYYRQVLAVEVTVYSEQFENPQCRFDSVSFTRPVLPISIHRLPRIRRTLVEAQAECQARVGTYFHAVATG